MNQEPQRQTFFEFLDELRRRRVGRFAVGYGAVAFVLLQLAEIVFPAFGLGEHAMRILVIAVALGFLPALVLAWIFDVTAEGIKRTEGRFDPRWPRMALSAVTMAVLGGLASWLWASGVFGGPGTAAGPATGELSQPPIRSVAVLPLEDFSQDGSERYFTAAMHEELIAQLSRVPGIRVVSRTSVMKYRNADKTAPEIGRELGVDALVEGSVTRVGDRVRVILKVIDAASDTPLETVEYEGPVSDPLELQRALAHELIHRIQVAHSEETFASAAPATTDPAAREAYLRGQYALEQRTPEGYREAIRYFEEALARDPEYAEALAGLAGARVLLDLEDRALDTATARVAMAEAREALRLDTASMEALEVLSLLERNIPQDETTGRTTGRRERFVRIPGAADSIAVEAAAFDTARAVHTTRLAQGLGERFGELEAARAENAMEGRTLRAERHLRAGRFRDAADVARTIVASDPTASAAWEILVRAAISERDVDEVVATARAWSASGAPGAPTQEEVEDLARRVQAEGMRGYWAWRLERLQRRSARGDAVPHTDFAAAYAGLGRHDEALRHLTEALRTGEPGLLALRSDPVWDELRSDPRFIAIERQARNLWLRRGLPASDARPGGHR